MNILKKNGVVVLLIVIFTIIVGLTVGISYAFFAASINSSGDDISGGTATTSLLLNVEKLVPTVNNLYLVPLSDDALQNAISGTNGQSSCIDANGNLSCHIYKITLTNNGSVGLNLQGIIRLENRTANDLFRNLKWQLLEDENTVKADSVANSMTNTVFESNLSINANQTVIYYVAVWISEINSNQNETDYGDFIGTIEFKDSNNQNGVSAKFQS